MAAPLMALVTAMTVWINATTGLPIPENVRIAYGDMPQGVGAMYYDGAEVVVLPHGWTPDNPRHVALLLHELVHAMQDEAGKMDVRPLCRGDVEREAYETMFKWMFEHGMAQEAAMARNHPAIQNAMRPCTLAETMPIGGPR